MRTKSDNVYIKRKYYRWLEKAKGYSEKTLKKYQQAFQLWENYIGNLDFKKFNDKIAVTFKEKVKNHKYRGKKISLGTVNSVLTKMSDFFQWLQLQPGYKSHIKIFNTEYLNLSLKEKKKIQAKSNNIGHPTIEQVKKIINSIDKNTEIDSRDRALFSMAICSGARINALASLSLECYNPEEHSIDQNPKKGVRTKYSKQIKTHLFDFGKKFLSEIDEWYIYLLKKGFGYKDAFFPGAKREKIENLTYKKSTKVTRKFISSGRLREIMKQRMIIADIGYYYPHTFRHACIHEALKEARSSEETKAISQNIGHEKIATTLGTYASLTEKQKRSLIAGLHKDRNVTKNKSNEKIETLKTLAESSNKELREYGMKQIKMLFERSDSNRNGGLND